MTLFMKLRKRIQNLFNLFGYSIKKVKSTNDLDLYYKIYEAKAIEEKRFYNIGAGGFRHPVWTNIDKINYWYEKAQGGNVVINWDMLELTPLDIEDDSAEIIYSSNTLEHVTDQAALNMLKESYRILKPGGFLRITVPNIDLYFRAYKDNDRDYFNLIGRYSEPKEMSRIRINKPLNEASIQQLFLWAFATNASTLYTNDDRPRITDEEFDKIFREKNYTDALDFCISKCSLDAQEKFPGNHINWWNKDKAFQMLKCAGFENIRQSAYGQSFSPILRNTSFFDSSHQKISLYIEANK